MKVLIIGSGGREHALCVAIEKSEKVSKIYCSPGNAGTYKIAKNIELDLENFSEIKDFVKKKDINLVIIGPEKPLVHGIVDYLKDNNIQVFGPNKLASKLEGSKIYTKNICEKYDIPTAKYGIFKKKDDAVKFLDKSKFPVVVKADGLASGKGVYICDNKKNFEDSVNEIFNGKFGVATNVLIEEYLDGEEMSFFVISDGKNFKTFGTAQDHKKVNEGDKGKNTGGMGAYSPSRKENKILEQKILEKIIKPTLKALNNNGVEFVGFLYAGLMIVKEEPYLIEYNVRMGDPECQTILPRLKTDFYKIIEACINKSLDKINIQWSEKKSLCIVLCAKGYPEEYENQININNLNNIKTKSDEFIFHAGTLIKKDQVVSNGGRVLNFTVLSNDFDESRKRAIKLINDLDWKNGFFRKDIGFKVID